MYSDIKTLMVKGKEKKGYIVSLILFILASKEIQKLPVGIHIRHNVYRSKIINNSTTQIHRAITSISIKNEDDTNSEEASYQFIHSPDEK